MIWYQVVLIFLAAIMLVTKADDDDEATTEPPLQQNCGQYGFQCLDDKILQFCPVVLEGVAEKAETYECDDDFYCDEDNPAFCTPREPQNKMVLEAKKGEHGDGGNGGMPKYRQVEAYEDMYFDEEGYNRRARDVIEKRADNCVCETTTMQSEPSTTTVMDEDESETEESTEAPQFQCEIYGFFADKLNSSLFWYCDVPMNGVGYVVRHMMCGQDRHYDDMFKNCVLKDTIRHERKLGGKSKRTNSTMNCLNKKPGKYADEADCRIYHLCLSKEFSPAVQLTFMCPRGTAYNASSQNCTIAAFNRCQVNGQQSNNKNNINCRTPTRFRSTEDCSSYFLCFMDNVIEIKCPKFYKFDDSALECLPEKVAECTEFSL